MIDLEQLQDRAKAYVRGGSLFSIQMAKYCSRLEKLQSKYNREISKLEKQLIITLESNKHCEVDLEMKRQMKDFREAFQTKLSNNLQWLQYFKISEEVEQNDQH